MRMTCLLMCMCVCVWARHHVYVWYSQKPDEGDGSSGTGTVDICELLHRCGEANSGTRQEELKVCVIIHGTGS